MRNLVFWTVAVLAVGTTYGAELTVETLKPNLVRVRETGTKGSGMSRYGVLKAYEPTASRTVETGMLPILGADVTVEKAGKGYWLRFPLAKDECVYGLGDVSRANIQRRPGRYEIWVKNVNSYIPIPMFITSKGRGVLVNTTWRNEIDVGQCDPDAVVCTAGESPIDFYVFTGKDYRELLDVYTELTGRPALLPVFGYGFTYVCNQWIDQFALMREAQEFRDRELPCDVIGLEPGWMENFYDFTTRKRWDPDKFFFPSWNPKGRITFPHTLSQRMGFKLSLWLCCDYDLYRYEEEQVGGTVVEPAQAASGNGFEADGETFHDQNIEKLEAKKARGDYPCSEMRRNSSAKNYPKKTVPEGREPWFEHLKTFVDMGARCFKLDGARQVTEHDPARKWANGMTTEEAHNLYPLVYGKQMARGYEEHAKQRAMIYSSGGYAGIQQYLATWAGDKGGGPKSLVSCLNLAASGHSNQSCDMTLFNPDNSFKVSGVHFGFLQPWSQQNNWDYWDQPWYQNRADFETFRSYVRLRYRLIPYLYGAAAVAARTGWPMMRPLVFMHPDRSEYANLSSTYYLGDALVVACYTNTASLPPGLWCDWWTGRRTAGPCEQSLALSEKIGGGLFVKAGAILPLLPDGVQHVERGWSAETELHVWTSADGAAEWYEDDGDSLAYRTGAYAITPLVFKDGVLTVGARKGSFAGMPSVRRVTVVWHTPEGTVRDVVRTCGADGFTVAAPGVPAPQPQTYYVDPAKGDDARTGLSSAEAFRTLAKAASCLKTGDTLELAPKAVFHERLAITASGTAAQPIVVHGNGAVLTGNEPVPDGSWQDKGDGLWLSTNRVFWGACRPRVLDANGRLVSLPVTAAAFKDPMLLKDGEAVWNKEGIWYRSGSHPKVARLTGFYRVSGVEIENVSHIVFSDLVAENFTNDGYNIHGTCRGLVFRNIVARWNGDDGFSVHEDVDAKVYGLYTHHNDYGIQDIGRAQSSFVSVIAESNRLGGVDFYGGMRTLRDAVVRDNGGLQVSFRPSFEKSRQPDDPSFDAVGYLESVQVTGGAGAALSVLSGARVVARDCWFSGTETGVLVTNGRLHLTNCDIDGCTRATAVDGKGRLTQTNCRGIR